MKPVPQLSSLDEKVVEILRRYPASKRSAAMPVLHLIQDTYGHITNEAIEWAAAKLELQPIHILELVTFYPMYRREPAGKYHIKVCRTLSCALGGGMRFASTCLRNLAWEWTSRLPMENSWFPMWSASPRAARPRSSRSTRNFTRMSHRRRRTRSCPAVRKILSAVPSIDAGRERVSCSSHFWRGDSKPSRKRWRAGQPQSLWHDPGASRWKAPH